MPVLTQDRDATWYIDEDYRDWIVAKNVTIRVVNQHGIHDDGYWGSDITLRGTIEVSGDAAGIWAMERTTGVIIESTGQIVATNGATGIVFDDWGSSLLNHGEIISQGEAIRGYTGVEVENYGSVRGYEGIVVEGSKFDIANHGTIIAAEYGIWGEAFDSNIVNSKSGRIEASGTAVYLTETGPATIVNDGLISSPNAAIEAEYAALHIVNRGTIRGDILAGGANDVIDTRKGIVNGEMAGGGGDDVYMIGRSDAVIFESVGEGSDFVQSTATFRLSANVEALQLLGKKDISAFGNASGNVLTGNRGDNLLSGLGGDDALYGVQGDDRLTGGAGADVFVFGEHYDTDRIRDFEDGIDRIYLLGVANQQEFDALKIRQAGDDVLVDYGRGDRLVIANMQKRDITLDDLLIA